MTRRIYDLHDEADRTEFDRLYKQAVLTGEIQRLVLDKHLPNGCVYVENNRVMASADVIADAYRVDSEERGCDLEPTPTGSTAIIATVNYSDGTRVAVKLSQVHDEVAISLTSVLDEMEVETIPDSCTAFHHEGDDEMFVTISEACRLFPTHAVRWQAFETLYRETLRERAEAN